MDVEAEARRARQAVYAAIPPDVGVMDMVEIFDEDRFRFRAARSGPYEAGVPLEVHVFDVVLRDGEWVLDATDEPMAPIGQITLGGAR